MFQTIGKSTVKQTRVSQRTAAKQRIVRLGLDVPLLLVTITLVIFGLLMVYSASWDYSMRLGNPPSYFFSRQVLWLFIGSGIAVLLSFIDYHHLRKVAVPAMVLTILALIAVLFVGDVRNNAVRTLLGGSVQPSELAKLMVIIYLSVWLFSKREQLGDVSFGLVPLAGILGVLGGLIFLQPDLSAVITIFFLGGTLFFLAGGDMRQIGFLVAVAILFGWVVVAINHTGSERVSSYLAGLKDPANASYHVRRSLEAFVNGGWLGVGIGKGVTKLTGLPVPPTDSIFAVIGEETGVLGATALVGLYTVLLWRGLSIARRAPDGLGTLLAAGLSLWLVMEAFVNMAVMVNLLPFAGNALPFVSAGGSNLVVSLVAIGILTNISRLSARTKEEDGRSYTPVVDLRRGDRRRRVPRTRRSSGAD